MITAIFIAIAAVTLALIGLVAVNLILRLYVFAANHVELTWYRLRHGRELTRRALAESRAWAEENDVWDT